MHAVTVIPEAGRPGLATADLRQCSDAPLELLQELPLAGGILVRVDPMTLVVRHPMSITQSSPATRQLLDDMVGACQIDDLSGAVDGDHAQWPTTPSESRSAVLGPGRWHRVAAVDALDRWVHAPLNPTLIDAERGLTRATVARFLSEGPGRDALLHEAVDMARRGCFGLETYIQQLTGPVPEALAAALRRVIDGYQMLATLGPDAEDLASVVRVGRTALEAMARGPMKTARDARRPARRNRRRRARGTSMIDPRQLPARVVDLSDDPTVGEVLTRRAVVNGVPVLDVEVAAFPAPVDSEAADDARERLLARFVDRFTGDVQARLALTVDMRADAVGKRHVFRARLPLDGLDPARLRVDVLDADINLPPVWSDSDPRLLSLRQSMIFLRDWRSLAASLRLGLVSAAEATARARRLANDPALSLTDVADDGMRRRGVPSQDRRRVLTTGAGDLLIAELAHAYELSLAPRP
jgi:hypothetical protein